MLKTLFSLLRKVNSQQMEKIRFQLKQGKVQSKDSLNLTVTTAQVISFRMQ